MLGNPEARRRCACSFRFEKRLRKEGYDCIAGIDEAGRGPLAGPVVAAAVVLPHRISLTGLNDSKQLPPPTREDFFARLTGNSRVLFGIGVASSAEIDTINILQATYLAMQRAVAALPIVPEHFLIDGWPVPCFSTRQTAIVDGDAKSLSIAAASVIAKVTRDRMMQTWHDRFPQYQFQTNKGYATPEHRELLRIHGPCEIHRRSFEPVAQMYLPLDLAVSKQARRPAPSQPSPVGPNRREDRRSLPPHTGIQDPLPEFSIP
jgi:ribonuclease HII